MLHQGLNELRLKADIVSLNAERPRMTRGERLERWAVVLEQHPGALAPFVRIESFPRSERKHLRENGTPVALAFDDPILRADGLAGDTLGDACSYFELSNGQAHRLLCNCHYRGTMTGAKVAAHLRMVAKGGIVQRIWNWARSSE
jgi:hypothetical protein